MIKKNRLVPIPTDLASSFHTKFEMEEIMEFESVNKGFHSLDKKVNENYIVPGKRDHW
jgi:hypothetical protein